MNETTTILTETETYTWEVWRDRPSGYGDFKRPILELVGTIESDSSYRAVSWSGDEALGRIAELGEGAGDYVLIHGDRVEHVTIVAETVYRQVREDTV